MRLALPLLAVSMFAISARADLTWEQKEQTLKATADAPVIEARYRFANNGKAAVDIQQIESSCGCTTADLEKRHYEPGESGEIVARFTVGARVGHQTKTIAVKTRGVEDPVTLTINVDIPEIIRIRPSFVFWVQAEAPKTKTMTLDVQPETPVEKMTVESSNPNMTPVLKEVVKGLQYELSVTPTSTEHVTFAKLTLACDFGKGSVKTFRGYATVKPAGSDPQ